MKISQIEIQDNSDGELFFEIPPALLEDLGWEEGDKVKFIPNENGTFTIKKAKYSTIEIDFGDDELLRYMTYAHERGMTFNELVEDCIKDFLIKSDFENDEI
jgi:bifunctional DNA-binding transcriptional regulator/antitoxin component of YhaV-PrlF toxin-antitoxin module